LKAKDNTQVFLSVQQVGGTLMTSRERLAAFFHELSRRAQLPNCGSPEDQSAKSTEQRKRQDALVQEELRREGF
jgi:hypothetical protein